MSGYGDQDAASIKKRQVFESIKAAFSLYDVRSRSYVSGAPIGTPFDLKNSFHTISAAEKEFRRVANPARPLAERLVSAAATGVPPVRASTAVRRRWPPRPRRAD